MKQIQYIASLLIILLLSASCGEDRSGEYYAKIERDTWIETTMKKHYLWYENMRAVQEKDYFAKPAEFLAKVVYTQALDGKGDIFSSVDTIPISSRIYLNSSSSYGFDFEALEDPLGISKRVYARVLYILPNSPASKAGLHRGDWISAVGKTELTVNNTQLLISGQATQLARTNITAKGNDYVWTPIDTISIEASRQVVNNPFQVDTTYHIEGKKIAYLMYNTFSTGPNNQPTDTEYAQQMQQIFTRFKSESPDAFILDLRYNTGGYLTCAQQLSTLLAPQAALNGTFCTLQYNNITNPQEVPIAFDQQMAASNLNLNKLYILTSGFTASASEAVINCLRPYLGNQNVVVVGETTFGKPVATEPFTNPELGIILNLVVANVLNSEGKADYAKGITPTFQLSERSLMSRLLPLGDIKEFLLKNTIAYILTGSMPDYTPGNTEVTSTRILYNSISRKPQPNIIPY